MAGQEALNGVGDTMIIVGTGQMVSGLFDGVDGVAHRDTATGGLNHGQIIDLVADDSDLPGFDAGLLSDPRQTSPFVDIGRECFKEVDALVRTRVGDAFEVMQDHLAVQGRVDAICNRYHAAVLSDASYSQCCSQILRCHAPLIVDSDVVRPEPPSRVLA